MNNKWRFDSFLSSNYGIYIPSTNDESYIPSVTWDDFVHQPMRYIECAVNHKEQIFSYNICKEV